MIATWSTSWKLARTNTQLGVTFLNWHLKNTKGTSLRPSQIRRRCWGRRRGRDCDLVDVFFSSADKYKLRISSALTWAPRSRQGFVEDDFEVIFLLILIFFLGSNSEEIATRRLICPHAWHNLFTLMSFNNHAWLCVSDLRCRGCFDDPLLKVLRNSKRSCSFFVETLDLQKIRRLGCWSEWNHRLLWSSE